MTPEELEQLVLLAGDAGQPQNQWEATSILTQWLNTSGDSSAQILIQLLCFSKEEHVTFFALTSLQRLRLKLEERVELRKLLQSYLIESAPTYMQVKVGVVMAKLVLEDFVVSWNSAFEDLGRGSPILYLHTLEALFETSFSEADPISRGLKDVLRGLSNGLQQIPVDQTISSRIVDKLVTWMAGTENDLEALRVFKQMVPWIDLSLILRENVMSLLFRSLEKPDDESGVLAMGCFSELIGRGMDTQKKILLLQDTRLLDNITERVNLNTLDESPVEVVIEVAKFVNVTGLEVIESAERKTVPLELWQQELDLFFRCFAYDDVDVSGAVVPLATRLTISMEDKDSSSQTVLPRMLGIMHQQMKYPTDFEFDYEDEEEAEEELYRTALRKLYHRLVTVSPDICLQFLCKVLASLPVPISSSPVADAEAALRLVYHFCEGIRPAPGLKVVMKNDTFVNVLKALHQSDVTSHPHREVLLLYYDIAVRYAAIFLNQSALLPLLLEGLSGCRGLQHEHPHVRSRSCYLLLKLIKSVVKIMRPFVETGIQGILGLLSNPAKYPLATDDILYLFETVGILLGKTGLSEELQEQSLVKVLSPHVQMIEELLISSGHSQSIEDCGNMLSGSVAAISYLSKGFNSPPDSVQCVLAEAMNTCLSVFHFLPSHAGVRKNCTGLWQRMVLCLKLKVLVVTPEFMRLAIDNCTADDVQDVAQMMNQCCIKFKNEAVNVIGTALLPFLRKCHSLMSQVFHVNDVPPHLKTEEHALQKLVFIVLNHVAVHGVSDALLSSPNASNFEEIIRIMSDGAIKGEDPLMRKSCIQFFFALVDEWGGHSDENHVKEALLRYAYQTLCPKMLESFLSPDFDANDALYARAIYEFSKLLFSLKGNKSRSSDFNQYILMGSLQRLGCPLNLLDAFSTASEVGQLDSFLKETLTILKANGHR
jgi:exportin-T